jgi:hypothetical protein
MIKSCNKNVANEEPYYTGRVIKRNVKHTDRVFSLLRCEHASSEELCASLQIWIDEQRAGATKGYFLVVSMLKKSRSMRKSVNSKIHTRLCS